jgi:hypothetical protein
LPDLGNHTATTGALRDTRPLARDQLPVPPQQRVWRDDLRDVTQGRSTQLVSKYRQPSPIVVGQPKPASSELSPEDTILFDQICERPPLPAIQPADDGEEQKVAD